MYISLLVEIVLLTRTEAEDAQLSHNFSHNIKAYKRSFIT